MFVQRIRVRFQKRGELRAISHLDLMRAFERALRRSGLPLRLSEGFNPRPRISFPAALGVGIEGLNEVMEFDLADWVGPAQVEARLREQLPPGLDVVSVKPADPHVTARVTEVAYRLSPRDALRGDVRFGPDALQAFMAREEILCHRLRKGKEKDVNIRPFVISLEGEGEDIVLRLKAGPDGSAHPEEVFGALNIDTQTSRAEFAVTRARVVLAGE